MWLFSRHSDYLIKISEVVFFFTKNSTITGYVSVVFVTGRNPDFTENRFLALEFAAVQNYSYSIVYR